MLIGVLGFGVDPLVYMPRQRIRALLAEAVLQGVTLVFLDSRHCRPDPADGGGGGLGARLAGQVWNGHDFATRILDCPAVILTLRWPHTDDQHALAAALRPRCHVLEERSPDKLLFAALLAGDPELAPFNIPTAELLEPGLEAQLAAWTECHAALVIKTADGKRGGGLFFLDRAPDAAPSEDLWRLRKDDAATLLPRAPAIALLARSIRGRLAYRRYLVQRYVTAQAADGRAADIRVHLQRRADGAWGLTRAYLRLGEHGMPLSNVSRGGYQGELAGFLAQRSRPAALLQAEILALAERVTLAMVARFCPQLTELGVDIALDRSDRLWLIEVNAHPGSTLHELERAEHCIGFARRLALGEAA